MRQHAVYRIQLKDRIGLPQTIERLSPEGYFLQPMISPKGDSVVFWGKEEAATGFNIWRTDLDNPMPVRLTDMQAVCGHPFWSSEANHIVFFSTSGVSGETEWRMADQFNLDRPPRNIWIMARNGKCRVRLTDGPHVDERPCISPDGKCVVFVSDRSGNMNLWSVSTDTGRLTQVTKHDGLDYRPIFSPDGRHLAFFTTNNPQGIHDLCVMAWPDGELRLPVRPGSFKWIHGPFWLADGKSLLIHGVTAQEENCALWVLDVDDGSVQRIELPGIPAYGHGTIDANESLLVFDSQHVL